MASLEPNKAYDLIIPENYTSKRVAFLGEDFMYKGGKNYWVYEHLKTEKVNRVILISVRDGDFLCDGETISPMEGKRWGLVHNFFNIKPEMKKSCSDLVDKLVNVGLMEEQH